MNIQKLRSRLRPIDPQRKDQRILFAEGDMKRVIIVATLIAVVVAYSGAIASAYSGNGNPVMVPDSGVSSNTTISGSYTTVVDTGSLVMGSVSGQDSSAPNGWIVEQTGQETFQILTANSGSTQLHCRWYTTVNGSVVQFGSQQWTFETAPGLAVGEQFTVVFPSLWTEKGCTQNGTCVTPLAAGDSLDEKLQCYSNPASYLEAVGHGGVYWTALLPF